MPDTDLRLAAPKVSAKAIRVLLDRIERANLCDCRECRRDVIDAYASVAEVAQATVNLLKDDTDA